MFSRLVPDFIKTRFHLLARKRYYERWYDDFAEKWNKEFLEKRVASETKIPKYDLQHKHIKNLITLLNRNDLLRAMPPDAVCAEIGVNEGEFSETILKNSNPVKLHLIDAWGDPGRYHDGLKVQVNEKFKKEINSNQVEINIGFSTDVLKDFPDHYFDWVYLDTDHTYDVTAAELNILKDKVKPNGIIAGHDYIIGNWVGDCRYGVIEAVHELCVSKNWEILYLTSETHQFRSFAIRRIS